jgi:hypothetical protein
MEAAMTAKERQEKLEKKVKENLEAMHIFDKKILRDAMRGTDEDIVICRVTGRVYYRADLNDPGRRV